MSAETKFTPGPWVINKTYATMLIITGQSDMDVCQVDAGYDSDLSQYSADDEEQANAHLIAAAPELYDALSGLLYHDENGIGEGYDEVIEAARLALAKARGEQNV